MQTKRKEDGRRYITESDYTKKDLKVKEEDVDLVGSLTIRFLSSNLLL